MSLLRTRWAAVGAAVAITLGAGGIGLVSATVSSGSRAVFVPITPCRIMAEGSLSVTVSVDAESTCNPDKTIVHSAALYDD